MACGALAWGALPGAAIETVQLQIPLLNETVSANVAELASPQALWEGRSDLAELNRATRGRYARGLEELLNTPLPQQEVLDSPMVQETEVVVRQLIQSESGDAQLFSTQPLREGLLRARATGKPVTLLSLLQAIPGKSVTIRLDRALAFLKRIKDQDQAMEELIRRWPRLPEGRGGQVAPGPWPTRTHVETLPWSGGKAPLEVTVVQPVGSISLPPVVMSHGLWDSPASFLGWAQHLASHGFPVFLPRHPGSDLQQQAAVLAGQAPPPNPREFWLRPLAVVRVLDGLDRGEIKGAEGVRARQVTMVGHSWGATTALQLAGARSLSSPLWRDCANFDNPKRNLSWVLQCTFLPAATTGSLADPRISRAVAVSPPQGLVFVAGLPDLKIPVLLISGSRDLVVPPQPEALIPFASYPRGANRLVVVEGGDHFNLPAVAGSSGGALRGLLLHWAQGQDPGPTSPLAAPGELPLRLVPR